MKSKELYERMNENEIPDLIYRYEEQEQLINQSADQYTIEVLIKEVKKLNQQVETNNLIIQQMDKHVYHLADMLEGLIVGIIQNKPLEDLREHLDLDTVIDEFEKYENELNNECE